MAQAQHAAIDTVQSSEGGGVLLGDVGAGEEERVSVSQVGERGPGPQVNRGLAVPGHCPVSTGIQHLTSSHQHTEMEKFPKNISRKNRTQGVDVVPDNDDSCAGVDQNVRTDSLTPPGPQYLIIHYYSQRALIYRMWKMYTFIKVKECINM